MTILPDLNRLKICSLDLVGYELHSLNFKYYYLKIYIYQAVNM